MDQNWNQWLLYAIPAVPEPASAHAVTIFNMQPRDYSHSQEKLGQFLFFKLHSTQLKGYH